MLLVLLPSGCRCDDDTHYEGPMVAQTRKADSACHSLGPALGSRRLAGTVTVVGTSRVRCSVLVVQYDRHEVQWVYPR